MQFFKVTGDRIYVISDVDMYQFFEKEKRGCISCISKKYGKPNNECISYDENENLKYAKYYIENRKTVTNR